MRSELWTFPSLQNQKPYSQDPLYSPSLKFLTIQIHWNIRKIFRSIKWNILSFLNYTYLYKENQVQRHTQRKNTFMFYSVIDTHLLISDELIEWFMLQLKFLAHFFRKWLDFFKYMQLACLYLSRQPLGVPRCLLQHIARHINQFSFF